MCLRCEGGRGEKVSKIWSHLPLLAASSHKFKSMILVGHLMGSAWVLWGVMTSSFPG